jgi:hypothetical protein
VLPGAIRNFVNLRIGYNNFLDKTEIPGSLNSYVRELGFNQTTREGFASLKSADTGVGV